MLEPIILYNLLESAATPLHVDQAREDIGQDGIPAFGRHPHDIPVLHVYFVVHSPGRKDFEPVVKHIDVDFTANDYNVADRGNRSFRALSELYAGNGQVGFVSTERVDGKLVLPEAVQVLKMAGTAVNEAPVANG